MQVVLAEFTTSTDDGGGLLLFGDGTRTFAFAPDRIGRLHWLAESLPVRDAAHPPGQSEARTVGQSASMHWGTLWRSKSESFAQGVTYDKSATHEPSHAAEPQMAHWTNRLGCSYVQLIHNAFPTGILHCEVA